MNILKVLFQFLEKSKKQPKTKNKTTKRVNTTQIANKWDWKSQMTRGYHRAYFRDS